VITITGAAQPDAAIFAGAPVKTRGVIFSWSGTLVDSQEAFVSAYREATRRIVGEPFPITPGEVEMVLGMPARTSFGMLSDDVATVDRLMKAHHDTYMRLAATLVKPVPGAADVLRMLRSRSIATAVVTMKPPERLEIDMILGLIEGLIDVVTSNHEADAVQPEPVRRCLAQLAIRPEEAVHIGVRRSEAIAAEAAGISRVLLLRTTGAAGSSDAGGLPQTMVDLAAKLAAGEHILGL
jgi:phosphoglycolate phosphatase-like HAD superfamily hydrolase